MSFDADIRNVVEKITAVMAQGEQCIGHAFDKPFSEWKKIFNAAALTLNLPLVVIEPLKSGSTKDLRRYWDDIAGAFNNTNNDPAIILSDASGNDHVKDQHLMQKFADATQGLTKAYPKAIYIMAVANAISSKPLALYCMAPNTPRATPVIPSV